MKRIAFFLTLGAIVLVPLRASAASSPALVFSGATVTATSASGESAIVLNVKNLGGSPISIVSVSSSAAVTGMLYYDVNMRQGSHVMRSLMNISVPPHATIHLGYQEQGAMLSLLQKPLVVGKTIQLTVKWTNYSSSRTSIVLAKVVKPPKGLHFLMPNMSM
jgi:copper(I)-binding protein